MAYGELGPTHHSIEDIAWTRAIDRLVVIVPADPVETAQAIRAAYEHEGPVFIRTSRIGVPIVHGDDYRFEIGEAVRLRDGDDVTIITNGVLGHASARGRRRAGRRGHRGPRHQHGHHRTRSIARPSSRPPYVRPAASSPPRKPSCTVGSVALWPRSWSPSARCRMRILGFAGFCPTGSPTFLFEQAGLTPDGIARAAREVIGG